MKSVYSIVEQKNYLTPLLHNIIKLSRKDKTTIIGIQGGQGTGKTTLSKFLQKALAGRGYAVESFSIDDFYTSYTERQKLARKYPDNPLYQISRGMPGTHRVKLLKGTLQKAKAGKPFIIPQFDKSLHHAAGDVAGERRIKSRQDFLLFEGWCLGLPLVSVMELERICRKHMISLPQGKHHQALLRYSKHYQQLWEFIDYLIMLQPKNPSLHVKWRWQQEQELRKKTGRGMNKKEIQRFVGLFLPLTYACYEKIKPDTKWWINERHGFYRKR